ncbi:MAG: hypothetical protein ACTSRE_16700 [Promethearchaeota archaeon]
MSTFLETLKRVWFYLKRSWFVITVVLVLILFFVGKLEGISSLMITSIVILSITIAGLILQIVLTILKFRSFKTYLESHKRIDDASIAHGIDNELVTVRRQLSELMKDKKCPGMIILLKNTYIYYNSKMTETFNKLYKEENFKEKAYKFLSKQFDLYKHEVQTIQKRLEELQESN